MLPMLHVSALAALFMLVSGSGSAESYSLLSRGELSNARPFLFAQTQRNQPSQNLTPQPLIQTRTDVSDGDEAEHAGGGGQSLFVDRAKGGLFAPFAPRNHRSSGTLIDILAPTLSDDPQAEMLRHLIAYAEAGPDGYDAVQYGAAHKPDRPPTELTLGDIFAWIEATPGQPHAIGRYQFIPSTLRRLVEILEASSSERFSPQMQDRLADILLHEAGLTAYRAGEMTRHEFMNNLAAIWAGLPNASGRSHYDGYAGNAATITWSQFESEMARIFQG